MAQRMNYDRVGARYDEEKVRDRPADPQLVSFVERGHAGPDLRALDVGCGTGIQQVRNRERFPAARLVGLDLHEGMLAAARAKDEGIRWVQGDAAALPFEDAEMDFVSNQFSFHHIQEKRTMLREVHRVLRPAGRFAMVNIAPRKMLDWDVYRYFPEAFALDQQDFPELDEITAWLSEAGFVDVAMQGRDIPLEHDLAEQIAFYRERFSPSQIVAIADEAWEAGLTRMERDLAEAGGSLTIASHVHLATLVADKEA